MGEGKGVKYAALGLAAECGGLLIGSAVAILTRTCSLFKNLEQASTGLAKGVLPITRKELHEDLIKKGYRYCSTSEFSGYTTYKGNDGRIVTIKPSGEVIQHKGSGILKVQQSIRKDRIILGIGCLSNNILQAIMSTFARHQAKIIL